MKKLQIPFIAAEGFDQFADALSDLWSQIWQAMLIIGSILLVAYGILVAATIIGAGGDDQKRRTAKTKVMYYTIGIIAIFVIMAGVPMIIAGMSDWAGDYA